MARATLVNDSDRIGRIIVIASFHDKSGSPMTRPFSLVEVPPKGTQPLQFVGPPGGVRGTIYIGGSFSRVGPGSGGGAVIDPLNRWELAGHGLLDLTLRAPNVYKALSLTLSGRNLLDQEYHEPAVLGGVPGDYPRPGRSVLLQASYLF